MGEFSNGNLEDDPNFTILDSDGDVGTPRKRRCGQASSLVATTAVPIRRLEVIDLTDNTEHCALCSNILGEGDDYTTYICFWDLSMCM